MWAGVPTSPLFVDRCPEMERLVAALDRAARGEGQFLVIRGEPGLGKTRLLRQLAAEASARGVTVGFGTALAESVVLYHPWGEALKEAGLLSLLDEPPPLQDPRLRQGRLFETVAVGLARRAGPEPLVLILDDLQWADPSSLAMLHYVARNTRTAGVLLLGAYRSEAGSVRPHLRDSLRKMEEEGLTSEFALQGLAREHLHDLATSFLGSHALPDDFFDLLSKETEGNPLFVREVLRDLEEEGGVCMVGAAKRLTRSVTSLRVPERVREVIRARLARLPPEDHELLEAASACGTRFTASLVAQLARREEERVLRGLAAIAQVHGLLQPRGSEYAFNHSAVHEEVYEGLPIEVRRSYHREAAEWLELAGGRIEDIGEHYYLAGDSRAVPMLREAAKAAADRYAKAEAIRFYSEALELEDTMEGRFQILEQLGGVYRQAENFASSLETYETALELAPDAPARSRILAGLGSTYHRMGRFNDASRMADEAWSWVRGQNGREEARALFLLGVTHFELGTSESALEYVIRSGEIAEKAGDDEAAAYSLNALGAIYGERGKRAEALSSLEKSLQIRERIGDRRGVSQALTNIGLWYGAETFDKVSEYFSRALTLSQALCDLGLQASQHMNLGALYYQRDEFDEALDHSRKALELSQRIGDEIDMAGAISNFGDVYRSRGWWQEARAYYQQALDISERIGDRRWVADQLRLLGLTYHDEGKYDRALEYHRKSLAIIKELDDAGRVAEAEVGIGIAYREQGELDAALRHLEEGLKIAEGAGSRRIVPVVLRDLADVYFRRGKIDEALELGNRGLALSKDIGARSTVGSVRRVLGMIRCERGEWKEAAEEFEEAIRFQEELGALRELGESHFEFGRMWGRKGDRRKAGEHLDAAEQIFGKLDLPRALGKVRKTRGLIETSRPGSFDT